MRQYNVQDEPIVISKATMDILLGRENGSDMIALYAFYYYTAKWQNTNQPKCTTEYTAEGLGWTTSRVTRAKSGLRDVGLIEDIRYTNEKGQVVGYYVHVKFIWNVQPPENQGAGSGESSLTKIQRLENHEGNALSAVKVNALSAVSKNIISEKSEEKKILPFVETRQPRSIRRRPIPEPERAVTPQDIIRLWNNWIRQGNSPLPKVTKLTSNRESRLKTRIKEYPSLKDWRRIFDKILDSTFLQGGKNRKGWMVDLDWIIHNDERIVKILEGRYDDARTSWAEEEEVDRRPIQSRHEDRSTFSKYDNIKKYTYDPDNPTEVTV